jgi:hypothetical protein
MMLGTFFSFLVNLFNPAVTNKAGPDWMWGGGRNDLIRNLYFKPNGAFRRYGFPALMLTFSLGFGALMLLFQ